MNARLATLAVVLTVLGGYGASQLSPPSEAQEPGFYRLAVDVDLVVLHASVRDRKGRFVSDLGQGDFEVYEDGVRQSIQLFQYEDTPVTVGIIVDHSRSMRPKLAHVIAAARAFVHSSNPLDQMFIVNFTERVLLGLPAAIPFTNSATELEDAISNAPAAGMTALYDGVVKGIGQLQAGSHAKKVLLVISDGGDNASARSLAHVLKMAEQSGAIIYTIGLFDDADPDRNPKVLKRLAHETGGEAFFPGQLDTVAAVCESIAREIRNQYTIGYIATNVTPQGAYRKVRVVAATGDQNLIVRTRAGYIAESESPSSKDQTGP